MTKRIITFVLVLTMCFTLMPNISYAATDTVKNAFNNAALQPRESTNKTLAKYVSDVMAKIDPKGTLSTYEKTEKAYAWVSKNIEFQSRYMIGNADNYMEDAAIYGFKNKKGPCEVDSATLVYLLRYIGLDAQWTFGRSGNQYHWWTEVIIGDTTYAFDSYPKMEKSFQARTGEIKLGVTKVGGFDHRGYYISGSILSDKLSTSLTSEGTMTRMRLLNGSSSNSKSSSSSSSKANSSSSKSSSTANDKKTKNIKVNADYDGDKKTDFSYTIPGVTKTSKIKIASLSALGSKASAEIKAVAGKEMPVYTIKVGEKIDLTGAFRFCITSMKLKNGVLYENLGEFNWEKSLKVNELRDEKIYLKNGSSYTLYKKGAYAQPLKEGYYIFAADPFVKQVFVTDTNSKNIGEYIEKAAYKYNSVILHVVKDK